MAEQYVLEGIPVCSDTHTCKMGRFPQQRSWDRHRVSGSVPPQGQGEQEAPGSRSAPWEGVLAIPFWLIFLEAPLGTSVISVKSG